MTTDNNTPGEFLRRTLSQPESNDALRPFRFLSDHLLARVIVLAGLDEVSLPDWIVRLVGREVTRSEKSLFTGRISASVRWPLFASERLRI